MAVRAAFANGNLTSASTWETCDSTSYSNSESANTALTTSQVSSSTFTPGAITIDGIGVKLASRAASPSGTMTVQLTQGGSLVTGTNVTINVSDLPTCSATSGTTTPVGTAEGGWIFFKFAAPVTLAGATAYAVSAATSVGSQVNLWSAATTNWSRYLRTTTTGAPAAGDDLIITGEWTAAATVTARTVTMDSTSATAYGSNTTSQVTPSCSISTNGTLSFGTTASTNYILNQLGFVVVYNNGTISIGTSGTPVPSGSTATLEFQCTNAGDFGLVLRNGAIYNSYGAPRTAGKLIIQTKLTVNLSAAGTSATVADDTGWLNGDKVCLAPTSQTASQYESATLNANATSSGLSFSAGVANAHNGTSPTQAEVGLITRNVVITSQTTSKQSYIWVSNTATVNAQWTELSFLGSNTANKHALNITTTTGSINFQYCSIHDSGATAINIIGSSFSNVTFQNLTLYNNNAGSNVNAHAVVVPTTTGTWTFDHVLLCGNGAGSNTSEAFSLGDVGGTFTNIVVTGNQATTNGAINISEANLLGTFSNITVHSCSNGISVGVAAWGTMSLVTLWRNGTWGIQFQGTIQQSLPFVISTGNIFGNGGSGGTNGGIAIAGCTFLRLISVNSNGDTTFLQENGIVFNSGYTGTVVEMYACNFSTASGILIANAFDFGWANQAGTCRIIAEDCITAATTIFEQYGNMTGPDGGPFITYQNFGQVANDNRAYFAATSSAQGIIQTNTSTVYGTNTRSEQMTPGTATFKLQSGSIYVACPSGKAATPIVQVQKNGSYAGAAPRLILKRQDSMGVTADTVVATFSAGANTWQALTGTTGAAPQDGIYEYIVDCDGTAGSVFVGDATATVA